MVSKDEALKMAIEALAKCKEAYLAGPNWQKVGYDILDKSQQACKEALEQPSWQGLSDDEINTIYANTEPDSKLDTYYMVLSRAIEQALKEKNHGI